MANKVRLPSLSEPNIRMTLLFKASYTTNCMVGLQTKSRDGPVPFHKAPMPSWAIIFWKQSEIDEINEDFFLAKIPLWGRPLFLLSSLCASGDNLTYLYWHQGISIGINQHTPKNYAFSQKVGPEFVILLEHLSDLVICNSPSIPLYCGALLVSSSLLWLLPRFAFPCNFSLMLTTHIGVVA